MSLHTLRMSEIKKTIPSVDKDAEKAQFSYWREDKIVQAFRKQFGSSLKVKHTFTIRPSHYTSFIYPREIKSVCPHTDLYVNIHTSFICNSNWK